MQIHILEVIATISIRYIYRCLQINESQLLNTTAAIYNNVFSDVHEVELGAYFEVVRGRQKGFGFPII
jgi:hypothetical protein